ncbi:MAG TPA: hypothetical protein VN673_13320, partial [Clostridia bacterium]|nr:hypothetical protein [Clostridia bacterium]
MGRLLDHGENPLAGATIRAVGISTGPSTSWGVGVPPGFPDKVVCATDGSFTLTRPEPFTRVMIHIEVPEVGSGDLWLDAGNVMNVIHFGPFEMKLPPLMHQPRPPLMQPPGKAGSVPIMPPTRPPNFPSGGPRGWTNAPAPPGATSRSSTASTGQRIIRYCPRPVAGTNETATSPVRRVKLAGQVRTKAGEPLPDGLSVRVRSQAEIEYAEPDSTGRFAFDGVRAGEVTVWTETWGSRDGGWRLTASNRNRRTILWTELTGLLEGAKSDLLLEIEPFRDTGPDGFTERVPDNPAKRPLWGAETSGPPLIVVMGKVLDYKTGEPVAGVKVIPSRAEPPSSAGKPAPKSALKQVVEAFTTQPPAKRGRIFLDLADEQISRDGLFSVQFVPLAYLPLLRFEAEGYQPLETAPFTHHTNLVIRLRRGTGPA